MTSSTLADEGAVEAQLAVAVRVARRAYRPVAAVVGFCQAESQTVSLALGADPVTAGEIPPLFATAHRHLVGARASLLHMQGDAEDGLMALAIAARTGRSPAGPVEGPVANVADAAERAEWATRAGRAAAGQLAEARAAVSAVGVLAGSVSVHRSGEQPEMDRRALLARTRQLGGLVDLAAAWLRHGGAPLARAERTPVEAEPSRGGQQVDGGIEPAGR